MNTLFRIAASALAVAIPAVGMVPAAMAATYSPFAKYFSEKPDFVIEQAFQYDNSYSYFVRVCNRGDTPISGGTLRISIGRDNSDREERYYSGVTPASGSCSNFDVSNVRKYGLKSSRTYGLTASVWWNGASGESALTNNSKNIPASPTAKTVPNSTDSYSWTKPPVTSNYSDPVNDLYLDRPNNPYSGRTWYYYSGTNYQTRCRGYWDASGNWRSYETHAVGSACYYDPYVPNSSGYYWYSTPANGYVPSSNSTSYRWDPVTGSYRSDPYYDQSYYGYPHPYPTSNVYADSTPNFSVSRFERDGSSRNLLATVCNNGGSMSASRDLTISFRDLSRSTSYKVSPYVEMRAGECRDFAVSFSNFPSDYSAYRTFEVVIDPDNRIYERNENDNSARANIWMER